MSRPPPRFTTLDAQGLEATGRPGFDVTTESRFDDPDAKPFDFRRPMLRGDGSHDPACPCNDCRCPKCDRRGGRTDCETCRILNAPPHVRGPSYVKDDAPDYNPQKPEVWPVLRYNGQRIGDPVHVKPTCAKCGLDIPASLTRVGDSWECTNKGVCEAEVASQVRVGLRKGGQP